MIYKYNSKAWMRSDIWVSWLKHINEEFQNKNRQILLLVDNASSHSLNDGETPLQLSNITLQYLIPHSICNHWMQGLSSHSKLNINIYIVGMF